MGVRYRIYKVEDGRRWYLRDGISPQELDNPMNGIGYLGKANSGEIPAANEIVTVDSAEDAQKICDYLRDAFYGGPQPHYFESF